MSNSNDESKKEDTNKEEMMIPCRCPECYLIPLITLNEENNKLTLKFTCPNEHVFNDAFNVLYNKSKLYKDTLFCKQCSVKKLNNKFYRCCKCNNFYCEKCKVEHTKENNHLCININKFDSRCKIHNKDLVGYCEEHKKNYCNYCPKDSHKFIMDEFIYDKELNDYLEKIKNYENNINNNNNELTSFIIKIENTLTDIKNMVKISEDNLLTQINFQKELINIYKYMKEKKNLNHQIIQNVRNIMKLPIKLDLLEDINNIIKKNSMIYENCINFVDEIKYKLGMINEIDEYKNFRFEKMNNIKTLNNSIGTINCLLILDDGRLVAGDYFGNIIIYNEKTFDPDIIIKNNFGGICDLLQLKNKNIICSFGETLKILKIKNRKEYEDIQIIKNPHRCGVGRIIELKNENIVTFSGDCSFKIWKLNNNNKYEQINQIFDRYNTTANSLDGLEIKDNEILYISIATPQPSLAFFNLDKNEKIKCITNLNIYYDWLGNRIIKLSDDKVVVGGDKKIYLLDINKYLVLHEIDTDQCNYCMLKISNNLFLSGDKKGTITQYRIENKKLIKQSWKNKSHEGFVYSMIMLNDMVISGGGNNDIKIWK